MSIKNMSNNFTNENTFNSLNKINNDNFNLNSVHLRDQFNIVFEELFKNSKKEEKITENAVPSLKENSLEEKKRELENKIAKEEKIISELEKSKKEKLIKVNKLIRINYLK